MLVRQPVVAGRFYPGQPAALKSQVDDFLLQNKTAASEVKSPWAVMLPHAGYVYCGDVLGKTLAGQKLPPKLVILCPNHTGFGKMLGVWPQGAWLTPLGPVMVAESLAKEIIESGGGFEADAQSHLREHSIEVILPFLQEQSGDFSIVPVCVGTQNPQALARAGLALAGVLRNHPDAGIVVSSDMNHYESERDTILKDEKALAMALAADPDNLLRVVGAEKISMCGAGPLALALYAARDLGGAQVELVAHETSGKTSGDYEHTVGYAGLRIYLAA